MQHDLCWVCQRFTDAETVMVLVGSHQVPNLRVCLVCEESRPKMGYPLWRSLEISGLVLYDANQATYNPGGSISLAGWKNRFVAVKYKYVGSPLANPEMPITLGSPVIARTHDFELVTQLRIEHQRATWLLVRWSPRL